MTTLNDRAALRSTRTDHRIGPLVLAGVAAQAVGWSVTIALGGEYGSRVGATFGSVGWGLGWLLFAGALLLVVRNRISGDGVSGRFPLVAVAAGACYVVAEIYWTINLTAGGRDAAMIEQDAMVVLLPAGALLGSIGMILTGVGSVRARRWTGWHRWAPLLPGVFPFVGMFPVAAVAGAPMLVSLVGWSLSWVPFGVAALRESR
jgi:hypothetical protein